MEPLSARIALQHLIMPFPTFSAIAVNVLIVCSVIAIPAEIQ